MFQQHQLRRIIVLLLITLLTSIGVVIASATSSQAIKAEIRGVWLTNVDSDVLFSREGTQASHRTFSPT